MSLFHDLVTECTTGAFEASPIGDWGMNSFLGMTIITPFYLGLVLDDTLSLWVM